MQHIILLPLRKLAFLTFILCIITNIQHTTAAMTIKWNVSLGSSYGHAIALDSQDNLYLGANSDFLSFTKDGKQRWSTSGRDLMGNVPTISCDGKTVYTACFDGNLYAYNTTDGGLNWFVKYTGFPSSQPALSPDCKTVFEGGSASSNMNAIDAVTGKVKWIFSVGSWVSDGIAVNPVDGSLYFGSHDRYLYALTNGGDLLWKIKFNGVPGRPTFGIDGSLIIAEFNNQTLYSISPSDGTIKWSFEAVGSIADPIVSKDGTIYFGTLGRVVYSLTPNGRVNWKFALEGPISYQPTINAAGPVIYFVSEPNYIGFSVDGRVVWKWLVSKYASGLSRIKIGQDGVLYASVGKNLFAINP